MTKQPANPKSPVVVSADVEQKRFFARRKRWYIISIIVVLIMASLVYALVHDELAKNHQKTLTNVQLTEINQDILSGRYQTAINTIQSVPRSQQSDFLLISVYSSEGNSRAALSIYQQVIQQYGANLGVIEAAASTAEQVKDYKQAISYCQQAEQLIAQAKPYPTQQAEEAYYNNQIKSLKAEE
jgi:tetratricopeptide (TPR) repeat protein